MKKVLNLLLLILGLGFAYDQAWSNIPSLERAALIALYNSTNGDNWTHKDGWKASPLDTDGFALPGTENTWYGVKCDSLNAHVQQIGLSLNNLTGVIPPQIGDLSGMDSLSLFYNQIGGGIPVELGNLTNLTSLNLGCNQLTGPIPSQLGYLGNLQFLNLQTNKLSGIIPVEISDMGKLKHLILRLNELSGKIPPELGKLSGLEGLDFYINHLSGEIPPELGNLVALKTMDLSWNELTGEIPKEIGQLLHLFKLSLWRNQLSGPIPEALVNLSELLILQLDVNQLSGTIPSWLGNLKKLQMLGLSSNQLAGSIPPEIADLPDLKKLALEENHLTGPIPSELGQLTLLEHLFLGGNMLSGPIPIELGQLSNLIMSRINYNALYTTDATLRAFLISKQSPNLPDWDKCQTIAPLNVQASLLSPTSIRLTWTPIPHAPIYYQYYDQLGGYRIFYGTNSGGPYTYAGVTGDKLASNFDLTGLAPAPAYYFVVQTQTNPHMGNPNTVLSEFSLEASAELGIVPLIDFLIAQIMGSDVENGIKNELVSILTNAEHSYEKGNIGAAINQMKAFLNKLKAQRGKKIPANLADGWSQIAAIIIERLSTSP
jgi:Leucine-rich repeat (LRR) protein